MLLGAVACARHPAPPGPGTSLGAPPDLRGMRVMLLPVQRGGVAGGDPDAELAFALETRGPQVQWVLPAALDSALERSPSLQTRTHGLPVGMFEAAEVERVGDPLYGDLRRLGAVANSDIAVRASAETVEGGSAVQFWAALVDIRTGRVFWFGVVRGEVGAAGDPGVLASAADKLARTVLIRTVGGGAGG